MTATQITRRESPEAHYAARSLSTNTRRSYAVFIAQWEEYAAENGIQVLPANPGHIARWLAQAADRGMSASSCGVMLASIRAAHTAAGHPFPNSEAIKLTMAGIRRELADRPKKKARPLTEEEVIRLTADPYMTDSDKAAILIGYGAALRRSEVAALRLEDLRCDPRGVVVRIRMSKTDQTGVGVETPVGGVIGARLREIMSRMPQNGAVTPLGAHALNRMLQAEARRLGFGDGVSWHSLRRGLATDKAERGATVPELMAHCRWTNPATATGYVEVRDKWGIWHE